MTSDWSTGIAVMVGLYCFIEIHSSTKSMKKSVDNLMKLSERNLQVLEEISNHVFVIKMEIENDQQRQDYNAAKLERKKTDEYFDMIRTPSAESKK